MIFFTPPGFLRKESGRTFPKAFLISKFILENKIFINLDTICSSRVLYLYWNKNIIILYFNYNKEFFI